VGPGSASDYESDSDEPESDVDFFSDEEEDEDQPVILDNPDFHDPEFDHSYDDITNPYVVPPESTYSNENEWMNHI